MIYETILTEHRTIVLRVKADSKKEAERIFERVRDEESDYIEEELDLNGTKEWSWNSLEEVHPSYFDERATASEDEDGYISIMYEGGDK